jgi:hypothetical protein
MATRTHAAGQAGRCAAVTQLIEIRHDLELVAQVGATYAFFMLGAVVRCGPVVCAALALQACGGVENGKTPVVSGTLNVAKEQSATGGCATLSGGMWATASSGFNDTGQASNEQCVLIPVVEEGKMYWLTSMPFEGMLGSDNLRHSFGSVEAAVKVGSVSLELSDTNGNGGTLFSGTLNVQKVTSSAVDFSIE